MWDYGESFNFNFLFLIKDILESHVGDDLKRKKQKAKF